MKLICNLLTLSICMILYTSCEKSDDSNSIFSKAGRKVTFSPNDRRGNLMDIGEVGTLGIDMSGYFSNSYGGLSGSALITCDRPGTYGYQVVEKPYGACNLYYAKLEQYDSVSYWELGETISNLSMNEIYYDIVTEAGTKRFIYFSQGSFTDYNYEIRVRYIEEK